VADASASTASTGASIRGYTYDFGEPGSKVGPQSEQSAGHTYKSAGTYTVSLTIIDTTGATDRTSQTVTVS
jgi:PKD repeat protein